MQTQQIFTPAAIAAKQIISNKNGIIRTSEALREGIHPRTLYALRNMGAIERVSRGLYRLEDQKPISNIDIVTVAARFPRSVICLVSALAFHNITTQIPHTVSIALERGAEQPRIENPPITIHRFSKDSLYAGIQEYIIDGIVVKIYSPEKTLADCFKFRNHLGMDVVLEALRLYKVRKGFNIDELLKFARICRVEPVMKPYLEANL